MENQKDDKVLTLIKNIRLAGEKQSDSWILIDGTVIAAIGNGECLIPGVTEIIDGNGSLVLPGVIDCHVHFREPGLTAKADIRSESIAAVAGGVTSYCEMPNTTPPTVSIKTWENKMALAKEKSVANYAFFIGATNGNIETLRKADYTAVPGVKLFMGSSTGNMLVDDSTTITRIFESVDAIVAIHAEDQAIINANVQKEIACYGDKYNVPVDRHSAIRSSEACLSSTSQAVALAKKYGRHLHVCHLTTSDELSLLEKDTPLDEKLITSEVSPHHLMWCDADYKAKGTRIKMNPAVKDADSRHALREALKSGLIDMVATDHAPHLLADKSGGALTAASGAPLVQFALPWMLDNFDETTVQRVMSENPARIFHIDRRGKLAPGYYADIVLVSETAPYTVTDSHVLSKCGWTPLCGETLSHQVEQTWVNGRCVWRDGAAADTGAAMPLRFNQDNAL